MDNQPTKHRFRPRPLHERDADALILHREMGYTIRTLIDRIHGDVRGSAQALVSTVRQIAEDATTPRLLHMRRSLKRT